MNDLLLEIAKRPVAKSVYNRLPMPMRLPQALERARGAWEEQPLAGRKLACGAVHARAFSERIRDILSAAGAEVAEAAGLNGLVFDATEARRPEDLKALYDFFHARLKLLGPCAHLVILGRAGEENVSASEWATQHALTGFVRSLGKEVGSRGATAQLLYVPAGDPKEAAERAAGPLLYFLSPRSAYISGQVLELRASVPRPSQVPMVTPLKGKTALVTGAAQGIGAAIARALVREGALVLGVDHPSQAKALESVVGAQAAFSVDLRGSASAETVASWLRETAGHVDIVVNNAGITRDRTLAKMEEEQWQSVLQINLEAPLRLTEKLTEGKDPLLADGGRLVYLSSVVGIAGNLGQTNYTAAKAGLLGFVECEAKRLAARGVTVNAMAPGFIETAMTKRIPFATREVARRLSSLKQGGLPEDVAECAAFLVSPGAYALTGAAVRICGQSIIGA